MNNNIDKSFYEITYTQNNKRIYKNFFVFSIVLIAVLSFINYVISFEASSKVSYSEIFDYEDIKDSTDSDLLKNIQTIRIKPNDLVYSTVIDGIVIATLLTDIYYIEVFYFIDDEGNKIDISKCAVDIEKSNEKQLTKCTNPSKKYIVSEYEAAVVSEEYFNKHYMKKDLADPKSVFNLPLLPNSTKE